MTEHLVQKGWNVAISDIDLTAGEKLAERLGSQVLFVRSDVASYDEQAKLFHETWKKWGRLDFGMIMAFFPHLFLITAVNKETGH